MSNTTNIGLELLDGSSTQKSFPTPYNQNMGKIDAAVGGIEDAIAIVANGNTHPAITSGQFVYVRNHNTLAEGLYRATANIAANGTLSGSNLTADSSGGLNSVYSELNGKIGSLSSLNTAAKNNLVSAVNEVYSKDFNVVYNANTDRSTESNRTAAMEYLKTNYFNSGCARAAVRYQSGYYHFYLFIGEYSGADSCILEVCHNMTPYIIYWRRSSAGAYSKIWNS